MSEENVEQSAEGVKTQGAVTAAEQIMLAGNFIKVFHYGSDGCGMVSSVKIDDFDPPSLLVHFRAAIANLIDRSLESALQGRHDLGASVAEAKREYAAKLIAAERKIDELQTFIDVKQRLRLLHDSQNATFRRDSAKEVLLKMMDGFFEAGAGKLTFEDAASSAVNFADALIAELAKPK